jgi:hypothetical protein
LRACVGHAEVDDGRIWKKRPLPRTLEPGGMALERAFRPGGAAQIELSESVSGFGTGLSIRLPD